MAGAGGAAADRGPPRHPLPSCQGQLNHTINLPLQRAAKGEASRVKQAISG
jgi:hypothetical protein